MMPPLRAKSALGMGAALVLAACSSTPDFGPTIASLNEGVIAIEDEVLIEQSREKAIASYRHYLQGPADKDTTPDAMRRLADLQVERSDEHSVEPRVAQESAAAMDRAAYEESIELYENVLRRYPDYAAADQVLYQLAKAHEHTGENEKAMSTLNRLVERYRESPYFAEAQFRRGEIHFMNKDFRAADQAYQAVLHAGEDTPYYEHALYKQGWSLFKQGDYDAALDSYTALLGRKMPTETTESELAKLSRAERELLDDTLRVISLSFSYQAGPASVAQYFSRRGRKPYEDLIYARLGEMYIDKERFTDAAKTYRAFVERNPYHRAAPRFQGKVIDAYRRGDFPSAVLEAKKDYVQQYGLKSLYWQHHEPQKFPEVTQALKANLTDLARHYHAKAQRSKRKTDYQQAVTWYRSYLESFPQGPGAPAMNFLLAEILFETRHYRAAAREYERTAYRYPAHPKAAEAGYAALLAYGAAKAGIKKQSIESALRFAKRFAEHPKAALVLTKAAEDLFKLHDYQRAAAAAKGVIQHHPTAESKLRRIAWTVIAHCAFDTHDYLHAESAYQQAVRLTREDDRQRTKLQQRLAASIYKQGEASRAAGDAAAAVNHFLRVSKVLPNAAIRATAEYDAAAALLEMKDWRRAATVLEGLRRNYPKHALQPEVTRKLAIAYHRSGQGLKAAHEFERIGQGKGDPSLRREALWEAAQLYGKAGAQKNAIAAFKRYVKQFATPLEQAIEARQQLADLYGKRKDASKRHYWLREIVKADKAAGSKRTDRTRYLAANAALTLAKPAGDAYRRVKLKVPLKKSLRAKKRKMEAALKAYGQAADYGVEGVTTASTYHIASIYYDFSRALMDSQRPKGLSGEALEQYDILLEEQAFPFEEQAIEIFEVNAKRTGDGLYDDWIKRSLTQLSELMPARYAKSERSEAFVEIVR